MAAASGIGIARLLADWRARDIYKMLATGILIALAILTARSAYQASFINYDTGKEFLVYAHAARGPKDVYEEVSDLSMKLTGGDDIQVAYIGDALYPYWWYFRYFPNKVWIKDELTRELLNYQVVISDDEQLSKTEAILKDNFYRTDYKRLLWPMQDYFNLSWKGLWDGIRNPEMIAAIFQIWLNKDYSQYAALVGNNNLTLETWEPSASIHLFIRKDIVQKLWQYGTVPQIQETQTTDPYEAKFIKLLPDKYFGMDGTLDGAFTNPRGIAIAPDGSLYVADSRNHRIQKFSPEGEYLLSWGTYASVDLGDAPGGTFNEPWGVAVAPDGSVFVADTWNYRVQKFDANGKFIKMWGTPGPPDTPTSFWGPRGITIDKDGLVLVTDTGNNRIVAFTQDGEYVNQFGKIGINPGEFDEPVGIVVDDAGQLYVVDTWNQRIQVFLALAPGDYQYEREWSVSAWFGQSINNKPFIALDSNADVYVTDPDAFRVLKFDNQGNLLTVWGEPSSSVDGLGSPCGIAVDQEGKVWVSDAENNFILRFSVPAIIVQSPTEVTAPIEPLPGLTYDVSGVLLNELGMPVYQLNVDKTDWVPIIPEGVLSLLPPGTEPQQDVNGIWVLYNALSEPIFQWDAGLMIWISVSPTSTP
jgi:DNA-binding beta-propeller fold protein YncE